MWNAANIDILGTLTFADKEETDSLKNYQIKLYNENKELLLDSGILYPNNYNGINSIQYTLEYELQDGEFYILAIDYETKNLYSSKEDFEFYVVQGSTDRLDATIFARMDDNNARAVVRTVANDITKKFTGNITIRRANSNSNFKIWEDVYTTTLEDEVLDFTWYDYTIESGVWYKYCAQRKNSVGIRGIVTKPTELIMSEFEDSFLTSEDGQLKLRLDTSISSLKRNISESRVDTIGSQFPYIKRNGYMNYKTFPITGLISYFMDDENVFTNKNELFGDTLKLYEEYNGGIRIDDYNDSVLEKRFRDKVMDFLYANNVKLFRSITEGNILVKLMDINLTPNQTLGRHLYSFSCTAYEIDTFNLKNCNLYNIQQLGNYDTILSYNNDYIGQAEITAPAYKDINEILQEKYQKYAYEGYKANVEYLDSLILHINTEPYLIGENAAGPYVVEDQAKARLAAPTADYYLGYLVYINQKPVIINPEGIYELKGDNVKIISAYFPTETSFTIDYHLQLSQTEDKRTIVKSSNYYKKIGQYWGSFSYKDSIFQRLWEKYYIKYKSYIQTLLSVDEIKIDADPGTVVFIKESEDTDFQRHVVGPTGTLALKDENVSISGIYFAGKHFEEATDYEAQRDLIPADKYIDTGITVEDFKKIEKPIENGVYTFTQTFLKTLATDDKNNGVTVEEGLVDLTGEELPCNDDVDTAADIVEKTGKHQITIDNIDFNKNITYDNYELVGNNHKNAEITGLETQYDKNTESISMEKMKTVIDGESLQDTPVIINYKDYEDKEFENDKIIGSSLNSSYIVKLLNDMYMLSSDGITYGIDELLGAKAKSFDADEDTLYVYLKDHKADIVDTKYEMILNRLLDKEFFVYMEELMNDDNKYIWHNNQWWVFTKDHDLICPVEGLIDYVCEIYKGVYAE